MASRRNRRHQPPSRIHPSAPAPFVERKIAIRPWRTIGIALAVFAIGSLVYIFYPEAREEALRPVDLTPQLPANETNATSARSYTSIAAPDKTRYFKLGNLILVWDTIKPEVRQLVKPTSTKSNIARQDYVGPEACQDCHRENFSNWSQHSHRWMNALANDETVKGDFSGAATMRYRGGVAKFYRAGDKFMMRYDRTNLTRVYEISQTIGSRFYQYYVGKGLEGPEPKVHPYYSAEHVLPFGYWLDRQAWVPVVHVHEERPDKTRWDSVEHPKPLASDELAARESGAGRSRGIFDPTDDLPLTYSRACNFCHTTFPLADMFVRMPDTIGAALTEQSVFAMSKYVQEAHPSIWDGSQPPESLSSAELQGITGKFIAFKAPEKAVTLGISCEACHLGCRYHVDHKDSKPSFAPHSPHLHTYSEPSQIETGRTHANVNSICARCHVGTRPKYAGGMSTWNSTEYTDALRGSCYSQLNCIDCHEPHTPIGKKWAQSPVQDDATCLKCHGNFNDLLVRQQHTHHAAGSTGDRCMNCHMPHINEGMQDVVRTHTIFSPTNKEMIEANHPNACNLCHLDKPIDWTIGYLTRWYGKSFSETEVSRNYPSRPGSVGVGWLTHKHEATRLVAAAAMARQDAKWSVPELVKLLDDEYLLNRQFTQTAIENLLKLRLDERFGYWYYMTQDERREPLAKIRRELAENRYPHAVGNDTKQWLQR